MLRFVGQRLLFAAISMVLLSITIFLLLRLAGDPLQLLAGPSATADELNQLRMRLGLDRPLLIQYFAFVRDFATGNLGESYYYKVPVVELYMQRLPASLLLAFAAMVFSLAVGVPIGVMAALHVDGWWDRVGKFIALLGMSLPGFWISLLMILFFSVYLRWLPSSGTGTWAHLVMPSVALGWYFAAAHMRLTRSSMLEVLGSEYIKLARLKGLPEWMVIGKHALRNALIPLVTLAGVNLVQMVNVAVVIEAVFAWPGIGRLLYEGISGRDFPVVQAVVLLGGLMIIVVNLLVDVLYGLIDPRIRHAR